MVLNRVDQDDCEIDKYSDEEKISKVKGELTQ
jgi:hypothetical protein